MAVPDLDFSEEVIDFIARGRLDESSMAAVVACLQKHLRGIGIVATDAQIRDELRAIGTELE